MRASITVACMLTRVRDASPYSLKKLSQQAEDRKVSQKGPPTNIAFDTDGNPQAPAVAFAKKCGVDVSELGRTKTDKGEWLSCELVEKGRSVAEIVPALIEKALAALPIPRRMRWGAGDLKNCRPRHCARSRMPLPKIFRSP